MTLPLIRSENRILSKGLKTYAELCAMFPRWEVSEREELPDENTLVEKSPSGTIDGLPYIGSLVWLDIKDAPGYYFVAWFGAYWDIFDPNTAEAKARHVVRSVYDRLNQGVGYSFDDIIDNRE